jgi:hypothetical protein
VYGADIVIGTPEDALASQQPFEFTVMVCVALRVSTDTAVQ